MVCLVLIMSFLGSNIFIANCSTLTDCEKGSFPIPHFLFALILNLALTSIFYDFLNFWSFISFHEWIFISNFNIRNQTMTIKFALNILFHPFHFESYFDSNLLLILSFFQLFYVHILLWIWPWQCFNE